MSARRSTALAPPYFHDGSAATLLEVVNRYNNDPRFSVNLTKRQKADLVEFLKSL
jgi:cytochrome c peroxidase